MGNKQNAFLCVTVWAGLFWIWARCLFSPCEDGKDNEASRTGGIVLTMAN